MNINVKFVEDDKKFNVGNFVNMQPINMKFWDATVIHEAQYIDDLFQKNTIILNCGTSTTVL